MISLNEKIKKYRNIRGLTLEELAKKVGSSKSYMWQLENDPKIKPSVQLITKISEALDATVDFLMDSTKEEMDLEQEAVVLYRGYKELDPSSKQLILDQIKHLKKITKRK